MYNCIVHYLFVYVTHVIDTQEPHWGKCLHLKKEPNLEVQPLGKTLLWVFFWGGLPILSI